MLYVTRHGETDWNLYGKVQGKANIELNAKGIEQAKETMEKLKEENIDFIICSPLKEQDRRLKSLTQRKTFPLSLMKEFLKEISEKWKECLKMTLIFRHFGITRRM